MSSELASTIYLDWRAEDVGAQGFQPDFECGVGAMMLPFHQPTGERQFFHLGAAECLRCQKILVRPAKKPPFGMEYRWACWLYTIEEEP